MDPIIEYNLLLILLGGMRHSTCRAFEQAVTTLPDLARAEHAFGSGGQDHAFAGLLAGGPGAFAKAPVVVVLAGAAVHHVFLRGCRDGRLYGWGDGELRCGSVSGAEEL